MRRESRTKNQDVMIVDLGIHVGVSLFRSQLYNHAGVPDEFLLSPLNTEGEIESQLASQTNASLRMQLDDLTEATDNQVFLGS